MKLITKIRALRKELTVVRRRGRRIGFVATMGALHEGHLSLLRRAREENDIVVVSIFVNPLQFGPKEDFRAYPRDLKRDVRLLRGLADFVFAPSKHELYRDDFSTFIHVRGLSEVFCGQLRPGHFTGVATVVAKLFHIVGPDRAYFGQKDAQQVQVIRRMVRDLDIPIAIKVLPIVREKDGLAMSSRNVYLSEKERKEAVVLFQALKSAEHLLSSGARDAVKIKKTLEDFLARAESARVDYIGIVDLETLKPLKVIASAALLLLAVRIGKTRLIDNAILKIKRRGRRSF